MTKPVTQLLNVLEVCELLGVTRSWVYDQIERNQFPVVVLGRRSYRFKPEDIQAFIDSKYQGVGTPPPTTSRKRK